MCRNQIEFVAPLCFSKFFVIFKIFAIRDNFLDFGRFSNLTIYCIAPLRLLVLFEWSIRVNYSLPFICILAELFFVNRIKVGTLNMFSANKKDFFDFFKNYYCFLVSFFFEMFLRSSTFFDFVGFYANDKSFPTQVSLYVF